MQYQLALDFLQIISVRQLLIIQEQVGVVGQICRSSQYLFHLGHHHLMLQQVCDRDQVVIAQIQYMKLVSEH